MSTTHFTDDDLRRLLDIEAADVTTEGVFVARLDNAPLTAHSRTNDGSRRAVRRVLPALAAAVIVAAAAVIVALHDTRPTAVPSDKPVQPGGRQASSYEFNGAQTPPALIPVRDRRPAANVTGSLLSGDGDYDLSRDAPGEVTVINFWGAWCGPCQLETPQLQAMYEAVRKHHVAFVGVDVKEAARGLPRAFVARYRITYPMIYDDLGRTTVTLGNIPAQGVPYTVLLDKHHRVAGVYIQRIGTRELKAALTKLIAEQ